MVRVMAGKYTKCNHCWCWGKSKLIQGYRDNVDTTGYYLVKICGHCHFVASAYMPWDEELHAGIPSGSFSGFQDYHNRNGCPPRSSKIIDKEEEYSYE